MLREIVLDTETTGTDASGDRIVEIGCVELVNHVPTGRHFHRYINPERKVAAGAVAVHGLTDEFLRDKPVFADVADDFAAFIDGGKLVIHNAAFDVGFINAEFARIGRPPLPMGHVVDTLALARRKHTGASNSLDALCARYGIDNSRRTKHGALLDAELLAEVYIELIGGKQASLGLVAGPAAIIVEVSQTITVARSTARREIRLRLTDAERDAHAAFIAGLSPNALWREYLGE